MNSTRLLLLAGVAMLALSEAPCASAQPASGPPAASNELQEVVVTARRREERLADVPIAVTNFTTQQLQNANIINVGDIVRRTPSINITNAVGATSTATINLRGQVQNDNVITVDPSVGVYLNDVYLGRATGTLTDLFDIANIEVLKGPQGTLYGRNTTGGAVRIITAQADPSGEFGGYGRFSYGNFDTYRAEAAVNIPISDKFALRFSGLKLGGDGFSKVNLTTGTGVPTGQRVRSNDRNTEASRLSAVFEPDDNTRISVNGDYIQTHSNGQMAYNLTGDVVLGGGLFARSSSDFYESRSNIRPFSNFSGGGLSATVDHDFGPLAAKVIISHRQAHSRNAWNVDGAAFNFVDSVQDQAQKQDTAELQFSGKSFDGRLDWIAGAFYFKETGDDQTFGLFFNNLLVQTTRAVADNRSKSVFAHGVYAITDALKLNAGIRYTWDTKAIEGESRINGFCPYAPGTPGLIIRSPTDCTLIRSDKFNFPSWTVGLDYHFNPDIMVYAKANSGTRSGGQNLRGFGFDPAVGDTSAPFQPEKATDIEVGIKAAGFENRVRLEADYYHTFYKQVQQSQIVFLPSIGATSTFVANLSDADVDGVEAQLDAVIAPHLTASLTGSYTNVKFDDPLFVGNLTPKWQGSAALSYDYPTEFGSLFATMNYKYTSSYPISAKAADVTNGALIPKRGLLDGRLAVRFRKMDSEIALWGRNLTNKKYFSNGVLLALGATGTFLSENVGEPRMYGVEFTTHF